MKNYIRIIFLTSCIVQAGMLSAQSIRKNYREMTAMERQLFVDALNQLAPLNAATPGNGAVTVYADNHVDLTAAINNTSIHNTNDFLPWHRWFILYFEKELQATSITGASKIALPYWDWTSRYYTASPTDFQKNSPLWTQNDLLFSFNANWNLNRSASTGLSIGTVSQLGDLMLLPGGSFNDFSSFRLELEGPPSSQWDIFHNVGHNWVGGTMITAGSPRDPAFWLHHGMVDKAWQDWENFSGNTSNYNGDGTLPNKGGSTAPNFPQSGVLNVTVPQTVDPLTISDGRASEVKVWYAEDGKVILDNYTASGTENYYYTGVMEAGSRVATTIVINSVTKTYSTGNFTIPSGTSAKFVSGGLQMGTAPEAGYIRLTPGFHAQSGSGFHAKIDANYFNNAAHNARVASNAITQAQPLDKLIKIYPNPSSGSFTIEFSQNFNESFSYSITNSFGISVKHNQSSELTTAVDTSDVAPGIHLLKLTTASGKIFTTRIVVN